MSKPTVREFADKIGAKYPTVYYWISNKKIPFESDGKVVRIMEAEAMESPVVQKFLEKNSSLHMNKFTKEVKLPHEIPPVTTVDTFGNKKVEYVPNRDWVSEEFCKEEKLFLKARHNAKPYIERARACRAQGKVNAEAELLWMAIQEMGFRV